MPTIRLRPTLVAAILVAGALVTGRLRAQNQPPPETPPSGTPTIKIVGSARRQVPIALPALNTGGNGRGWDAAVTLHDVVRDELRFAGYVQTTPDEYPKLDGPFRDRP